MISYKADIVANIGKGRVLQALASPTLLSAALGHFSVFHGSNRSVYDVVLSIPTGKKVISIPGKMKGPEYYVSSVGYNGVSLDRKVKWSFVFELKEKDELTTVVRVHTMFDVRAGLFSRFSGLTKAVASMPKHIVEKHVRPYLTGLTPPPPSPLDVQPVIIFTKEGDIRSLFEEAYNAAGGVGSAVIVLDVGKVIGLIMLKDSRVLKVKVIKGLTEEEVDSIDKMLSMMPSVSGKVTVYTFDPAEVFESLMERFAAGTFSRNRVYK